MNSVSNTFKRLSLSSGRQVRCRIEVGGRVYGDDRIIGFEFRDVAHEDWFTIGAACPNEFTFTIEHLDEPDVRTLVRPFISFDGNEWLQLGVFYIERRYFRGRFAKFFCYDKLYELNKPPENIPAAAWANADTLLAAVCESAGLTFSGNCPPYQTFEPQGNASARDIIGYIAALDCACARINKNGQLVFKRYYGMPTAEISERNVFSKNINMTAAGIRGMRVNTGSSVFAAGDGTGLSSVDIYDPFMTRDQADSLCAQLAPIRFYGGELEMQGQPYFEAGELMLLRDRDDQLTPIALSEIKYIYDGSLVAKVYSKNKYNSDPVVRRQEFENALAYIWERIYSIS